MLKLYVTDSASFMLNLEKIIIMTSSLNMSNRLNIFIEALNHLPFSLSGQVASYSFIIVASRCDGCNGVDILFGTLVREISISTNMA